MNRFEKTSNDLTALAPKWSERGHLLAALPKHLADSQEAIKSQQNIDKEMTDLSLIASAWLKSQQQKELLEARLKRFKETAGYPSMASVLPIPAVVGITNKEQAMNNLDKAASFDSAMGKSAGLFWKKLDRPVGIKSLFGPDDGATSMRLDAERIMEPRLLTRLFSSPRKDYDHMFSAIKLNEEYGEDRDSPGNQALATPEGRAMLASYMLPRWYPDRYKQEGDSPIGGEDIFENAVYRAKPGLKKAASFGAMMGKIAADPRIFDAPYAKGPGSNGVQHIVNSPAQDARMLNSTGEADSQLYGLRAPVGFTNHGSEGFSRDKNPKDLYNRDGSKRYGMKVKDSVPASSWRSKPVSYKVDEIQNEKHYNEMTNMNRANPPKDINGVPAARARISNQQDSNAAQTLPYLLSKKF
jgi:hypothetical protein